MKINVVVGMPGIGKSKYIEKHKAENDVVINFNNYRKAQKNTSKTSELYSFYKMLADIEIAMKENSNTNTTIWIEGVFLSSFRREIICELLKIVHDSIENNISTSINLIWAVITLKEFMENYKNIHPELDEETIKTRAVNEFNFYKTIINKTPPNEDCFGWDSIIIINPYSGNSNELTSPSIN